MILVIGEVLTSIFDKKIKMLQSPEEELEPPTSTYLMNF